MRNQHLAIETFELLLSGDESDKKHAAYLVGRLDVGTLARLREVANELAAMAEMRYFEKRRQNRGALTTKEN